MSLTMNKTVNKSLKYFNISTNKVAKFAIPMEPLGETSQSVLEVLYSITAALSFFGNVIVIIVLIFGNRSSKDFRKFLINLALADLSMAIFSIPFTYTQFMLGRWIYPDILCPFAHFVTLFAMCLMVFTLSVIGVGRYFAIIRPMEAESNFVEEHSSLYLAFIWLLSFIVSGPQIFNGAIEKRLDEDGIVHSNCVEQIFDSDNFYGEIYTIIIFLITFVFPILILGFVYGSIGYRLRAQIRETDEITAPTRAENHRRNMDKAIIMITVVFVCFALFMLPLQIFNLLAWLYGAELMFGGTLEQYTVCCAIFFVCHLLAMSHSFVNPVIYCYMSDNFRKDLKEVVVIIRKPFAPILPCLPFNRNPSRMSRACDGTIQGTDTTAT